MLALFTFIITIIGCLNWLCIGFFQFDFVAGLFGTQSSIFSRLIYIIIGFSSVFLTYAVIRYKGRLTIKKNKHQDEVLKNQIPAPNNLDQNNLYYSQNSQTNQSQTLQTDQQNPQLSSQNSNTQTYASMDPNLQTQNTKETTRTTTINPN